MPEAVERPEAVTARETAKRIFRHENAVLAIVLGALIGGMGVATKGVSIRAQNMVNVLLHSSIRGVATIGQAFVILSGGIDLSIGGVGLFCSLLGVLMMTEAEWLNLVGHPVSIYIGIPVMLLAGAGWGTINGVSVSRIGMPPLIVTLAMWEISKGAAFRMSGGTSAGFLPESLAFFGSGRVAGVPVPIIIFIGVAAVAYFVLHYTSFGRSAYAVGGSPVSAWLSGINVRNVRFTVYVISGLLTGLAAVLVSAFTMIASMRTLEGLELDTIAAVCIGGVSLMGGRGTVIGAVIGVLIVSVINNAMTILGAEPTLQNITKGAIIITAVAIDYVRRR